MHRVLSSGQCNWRGSFTIERVERALLIPVDPDKVLGRGEARLSSRKKATAMKAAEMKAAGATSEATPSAAPTTALPRMRAPAALTKTPASSVQRPREPPRTPEEIEGFRRQVAKRARISSGRGGDILDDASTKRPKASTPPLAVAEKVVQAGTSSVATIRRSEASKLLLHLGKLVDEYAEDVRVRDSELSETKKANVELQLKFNKLAERNKFLESDVLSARRNEEELRSKLVEVESARSKDIATLKDQLAFAYDSRDSRIDEAISRTREEVTCGFEGRLGELSRLLTEINGKAKENILDLAEIDANLEFIELLQKPDRPSLEDEFLDLKLRRRPIYDARNVFAELVAEARGVLGTPLVASGAADARTATDYDAGDDEEESDEEIDE